MLDQLQGDRGELKISDRLRQQDFGLVYILGELFKVTLGLIGHWEKRPIVDLANKPVQPAVDGLLLCRIIDCARKVVVFDGTDRQSLDDLREAIFKFGEVNDLISRFYKGEL